MSTKKSEDKKAEKMRKHLVLVFVKLPWVYWLNDIIQTINFFLPTRRCYKAQGKTNRSQTSGFSSPPVWSAGMKKEAQGKQAWIWLNKKDKSKTGNIFLSFDRRNTHKSFLLLKLYVSVSVDRLQTGIFPLLLSLLGQHEEKSLNNKPIPAFFFLQLRWCMVGSFTILIDVCGNYSSGRQQTVNQGQCKTINHNSWFHPPERGSTKKQFCQHVFAHLSS